MASLVEPRHELPWHLSRLVSLVARTRTAGGHTDRDQGALDGGMVP